MKTNQPDKLVANARFFRAFVQKEFYHILRDKTSILLLLAMPVMMLVLFGYALNTEVKSASFAVYDPSHDDLSRSVVERLQANHYFVLKRFLQSPDEAEDAFRKGEVRMVLIFPDRFYEKQQHEGGAQVLVLADGSDPNTASVITNYVRSILAAIQLEKDGTAPVYTIVPEIKLLYNPSLTAAYNFVPGVMGMILLLICAMMTSVSITREKERGTLEVLLVSPVKPLYVILSKAVPYFVLSLVNLTTILLIACLIMQVPVAGSLPALIVLSFIYIFVCLALGLLISSLVETQMAALLISAMGLMMPVMLLSGMMFPVENMPLVLQGISDIIPARWFIEACRKIMIKGLGFDAVWKEMLILSAMGLVLITISLKKFKIRLE